MRHSWLGARAPGRSASARDCSLGKIENRRQGNIVRFMLETPRDPAASHYEHPAVGLRRRDLDPDPVKHFANWFTAAIEAGIRDVNAMSLATAGRDGKTSIRIVLLKGFDRDGFVFFSNYQSEKGRQLEANPYAGCLFYWIELDRQIRLSGHVEKISREESERYFHSRPRGSQLGAWASRQRDRKSTRLNSSHIPLSRMPSS